MNFEREILNAARDGIVGAIKDKLSGYSSPLSKMVQECFDDRGDEIRGLLYEALDNLTVNKKFREQMIEQIQHKLARVLVQDFSDGIFKKNINVLKSDPTVKARCVLAVENIINEELKNAR